MSLLTPYQKTSVHGLNFPSPPPDVIKEEIKYEVNHILDSHCISRECHLEYLICWKGYFKVNDSWEPQQNIHALNLIHQFHTAYPSVIQANLINPFNSNDINAPSSSLNTFYPLLIPLPKSPLSHRSIHNGMDQAYLQGSYDEASILPLPTAGPTDVNTPMDSIPTYAAFSDLSSKSGGDTDSGSNNGC